LIEIKPHLKISDPEKADDRRGARRNRERERRRSQHVPSDTFEKRPDSAPAVRAASLRHCGKKSLNKFQPEIHTVAKRVAR
jgi:hypothetical protein